MYTAWLRPTKRLLTWHVSHKDIRKIYKRACSKELGSFCWKRRPESLVLVQHTQLLLMNARLSAVIALALVLTACGPVAAPTNSNAPVNANVSAAPASIPTGVQSLLQKAATAMELGSVRMEPTTLQWPLGEEQYRSMVPAKGGQFTAEFKGDGLYTHFILMDALQMENGGVPLSDATTETSAVYDFPYVCLLRQPLDTEKLSSFTVTVSCGELDATAFKQSATLASETDKLFADITKELKAPHDAPADIKFVWGDMATYGKDMLVQGREAFFPKLLPRQIEPAEKDLFEKLGFEKTIYSAEGTVTGAQGYQRGKLGCIVISSVRGWREEISKPASTSTGESMPFYEKQPDGTSEMTVRCAAVE